MATATEAPAEAAGPTSHTQNQLDQLARMREPFTPDQVSKLPRINCGACRDARWKVCEKHERQRCDTCAGNLTNAHFHLDYVGHAELTGRLLEVDPLWEWEPLAFDADGLPKFDHHGGLWIKLTVAGLTRLGYGDSQEKRGPNAVKEAIGDALRNAAMRFGAALTLWSKTDMDKDRAETEKLTREPTREDRLADLYVLMQKRWGSIGGLRNVKALVDAEDFHRSLVAAADGTMHEFGELIVQRIAELEAPKQDSTPARQNQPPAPAAAADGTPPAAADTETAELDRLAKQARTHWDKPVVLEQVKGAVAHAGLIDHKVQGPPAWDGEWMGFGDLLDRRLAELKDTERSAA